MPTLRRVKMVLLLMIAVLALSAAARAAEDAPRISKEDVRSLLGDAGVIILDARTGSSWSASEKKVKGAVRVDPSDVGAWADSIPKDKMIVVYCS